MTAEEANYQGRRRLSNTADSLLAKAAPGPRLILSRLAVSTLHTPLFSRQFHQRRLDRLTDDHPSVLHADAAIAETVYQFLGMARQ